jgi:RNA polymerase sigma-70 factor (ECF subfamily)
MTKMEKATENAQVDISEEKTLIQRAKTGDRQAFNSILVLYRKRVFRLAYGFFHDRDDAMEIVQETFIRVFEKLDHFDEHAHFRSWIYRITLNLCVDYYRKFKKRSRNPEHIFRILQQQEKPAMDPEDHLVVLNQKQVLRRSISLLPKRQKLIFVLKHYGHYKYREIAEILDISVGSIKSLHHRSINRIKKDVILMRSS